MKNDNIEAYARNKNETLALFQKIKITESEMN
jgi:hypothetical protein